MLGTNEKESPSKITEDIKKKKKLNGNVRTENYNNKILKNPLLGSSLEGRLQRNESELKIDQWKLFNLIDRKQTEISLGNLWNNNKRSFFSLESQEERRKIYG